MTTNHHQHHTTVSGQNFPAGMPAPPLFVPSYRGQCQGQNPANPTPVSQAAGNRLMAPPGHPGSILPPGFYSSTFGRAPLDPECSPTSVPSGYADGARFLGMGMVPNPPSSPPPTQQHGFQMMGHSAIQSPVPPSSRSHQSLNPMVNACGRLQGVLFAPMAHCTTVAVPQECQQPPILPNALGRNQAMTLPTGRPGYAASTNKRLLQQLEDQNQPAPKRLASPGGGSADCEPEDGDETRSSIISAGDDQTKLGVPPPPPSECLHPSAEEEIEGCGVPSSPTAGDLVATTPATEKEVQKLLSIALSNTHQRGLSTPASSGAGESEKLGPVPDCQGGDDKLRESGLYEADVARDFSSEAQSSEALGDKISSADGQENGDSTSPLGTGLGDDGELAPMQEQQRSDDLEQGDEDNVGGEAHPEDVNIDFSNPTESDRVTPDSDEGMSLAKFELYTATLQPDKEGLFFCHLCEFTGKNRQEFHDHLRTHYDYKCTKCDYTSRTEGRLKRHLKDFHSDVPPQNFSGKITRSNKPKTQKCKQCNYNALTKDDYWMHQRSHIKEDKRLECPRCLFVTEYKHHLEYHIRNHFGSKPYKCPKCNYECVNKSMLNSHMKSHTNVYQYRCADCIYATKYCHSLKLHLAKHGHSPATVLNADGSLPDYDNSNEILNIKRGPHRTSRKLTDQKTADIIGLSPASPRLHLPAIHRNGMNPGLPPVSSQQLPPPPMFGASSPPTHPLWPFLPQQFSPGLPLPPPFGLGFPGLPHFPTQSASPFPFSIHPPSQLDPPHCLSLPAVKEAVCMQEESIDALDLSAKQPASLIKQNYLSPPPAVPEEQTTPQRPPTTDGSNESGTRKRPRKSRAFRIYPSVESAPGESVTSRCCEVVENSETNIKSDPECKDDSLGHDSGSPESDILPRSPPASLKDYYECRHCEILFKGRTLFDIHMGFHCHSDPFLCNRCGHQSRDRVDFFTHLGEVPHA